MPPHEPYIRGNSIFGLPQYIDELGGDSAALLVEAGLPVTDYSRPELLVSLYSMGRFMECAANALNQPDFGVRHVLNMPAHLPNLAPFIMLAKFEKDCRGWLLAVQKYLKAHTNGFDFELIETIGAETAVLRYNTDALGVYSRQMTECILAKIVVTVRNVTNQPLHNPQAVRFRHSPISNDLKSHHLLFGCPIQFNSTHTEIEFSSEVLSMKTDGNLALLKSLLGIYVEYQMSKMPAANTSHSTMVSLAIAGALGTGNCTINNVADSFGLSSKKLQRLLAEEATTFSEILEKVRRATACNLLEQSDISITRIASMLDYAGSPPFNLAFRRWTGHSPMEYRKRNTAA